MSLRIEQMRNFFKTFFGLPTRLSAGFLSNDLSSVQLLQFAFMCFVQGNNALRALLLTHLVSAGAGVRLGQAYAYPLLKAAGVASVGEEEGGVAAAAAALPSRARLLTARRRRRTRTSCRTRRTSSPRRRKG